MLGRVITCHDDRAQEVLDALERKHGALLQCQIVNFWRGLNSNIFNYMICDALREADSGEGVASLTGIAGTPPYRAASLLNHKHSCYEVISSVTLPLVEQTMTCRGTMTNSEFRERIAELGAPEVSSLRHRQQKNPSFALRHSLYGY